MTWFKVDDNFWSHPKTLLLSDAAIAAWVKAGSYCGQHLTDGFLPESARTLLGIRTESAIDELVDAGLWTVVDGGWQFHDWSEYQPSRDSVEDRRARDRDRKAAARAAHQRKRETSTQSPQGVRAESAETPQGIRKESALPDPTRPDPTNRESVPARASRKRPATRLPDDWRPTEAHHQRAHEIGIDLHLAAEKFKAHAAANDRRQVDWSSAFTNWLLNEKPHNSGYRNQNQIMHDMRARAVAQQGSALALIEGIDQ